MITTPVQQLSNLLQKASAIVVGAGSGLSTSAGFIYTGERFERYFSDFIVKYHFPDMYLGGFHPFSSLEEYWAYWSRYIYINRYMQAPKPVYQHLLHLVQDKDYFVITTNVDHCFQKAGFDSHRLFYTQGDYGLWQCSEPCHMSTYDNEKQVRQMVMAQGFTISDQGDLIPPSHGRLAMTVPSELIPHCPRCQKPMTMNLRADQTFVEDEGWHRAAERYSQFLRRHQNTSTLFLEAGVGFNTPSIVKFSFWQLTAANPEAVYACINLGEAYAPKEIADRTLCIREDIGEVLKKLK